MQTQFTPAANPVLLIATVGRPDPLASVLQARPYTDVCFLCSPDSVPSLERAAALGYPITADTRILFPDPQDFPSVVEILRTRLTPLVHAWENAYPSGELLVDFTGGTKCMTAAAALVARTWKCRFQYIGGERQNLGNVSTGAETPLVSQNPWSALGYQAAEQAITMFDGGSPAAAQAFLDQPVRLADEPVKSALAHLRLLIAAYASWDRFEHEVALEDFQTILSGLDRLQAFFTPAAVSSIRHQLQTAIDHLQGITATKGISRLLVLDLMANAFRRMQEGRFDDAVARLYRATEALAQLRLAEAHGLHEPRSVPLALIPPERHKDFSRGPSGNKMPLSGLRDDFALLSVLGDPLGTRFAQSDLNSRNDSPLSARNRSILAHGFRPLHHKDAARLLDAVLDLAGLRVADLPLFPKLAPRE